MADNVVKLIVSNLGALKEKYLNNVNQVQAALFPIVAADSAGGVDTTVVYMDDAAAMRAIGVPPVTKATDEAQNKATITALVRHYGASYVMILGAPDIVPHQLLDNPMPDMDRNVPSDLPYASMNGFSRSITDFLNPTVCVTRAPDVTGIPSVGAKDTSYLLRVLAFCADRTTYALDEYKSYFAVSCASWSVSSGISLDFMFGNHASLRLSPPDGPDWSVKQMRRLSHFVNCHGASSDPRFYGEPRVGGRSPVAMSAEIMEGGVYPGAVMSAECCYGAQLYDPEAEDPPIHMSMSNTYMQAGAKGYLGSSNIAYGPPGGNAQADLITKFLLSYVLDRHKIGPAVLAAQQRFIRDSDMAKPSNIKTIGQFMGFGDPAMPAVAAPAPMLGLDRAIVAPDRVRMEELARQGMALERATPYGVEDPEAEPSDEVLRVVGSLLEARGVSAAPTRRTFRRHVPREADEEQTGGSDTVVHAFIVGDADGDADSPFERVLSLEITERDGEVISVDEAYSK